MRMRRLAIMLLSIVGVALAITLWLALSYRHQPFVCPPNHRCEMTRYGPTVIVDYPAGVTPPTGGMGIK